MPSYQKVVYTGRLNEYQKYGNNYQQKRYVEYERDEFNQYQNFLYKRAIFGLTVYSPEELQTMHWDKKKRIQKVHARAQSVLNTWKQQLANEWATGLLSKIFHHSQLAKDLIESFGSHIDPDYISPLEFKSLGISKRDIVEKLISEKILPNNFYQLKAE